jgi:hypothetical protein
MDADGYFWYEGRADDVIITAGYRVIRGEALAHESLECLQSGRRWVRIRRLAR